MAHKNLLIFLSTYLISKGSFGHFFTDIVTFLAPDILLNMYTITRLLIHGFFFRPEAIELQLTLPHKWFYLLINS